MTHEIIMCGPLNLFMALMEVCIMMGIIYALDKLYDRIKLEKERRYVKQKPVIEIEIEDYTEELLNENEARLREYYR